jgi:hypothetical protein
LNDSEVTFNDEKYSSAELKLIMGLDEPKEPKPYILLVARALKCPMRLPWFLSDICTLCLAESDQRDLRLALIRVQIDAELRMNQDIQKYQQRRYVAQVIEILLFNELLLAPREQVTEGDLE